MSAPLAVGVQPRAWLVRPRASSSSSSRGSANRRVCRISSATSSIASFPVTRARQRRHPRLDRVAFHRRATVRAASSVDDDDDGANADDDAAPARVNASRPPPGAEVDLSSLSARFKEVATPFWVDPSSSGNARLLLIVVVCMTLGTTAISVGFNFLGRDFYNSIAEKNPEDFDRLLKTYIAAIAGAIPVFVFRDYYQQVLTLKWRGWMTERYVEKYLDDRNFYHIQTGSVIDNPDQRIVDDISAFTSQTLGLAFTLLNAGIDLVSFSGILFGIYKPLVGVLFVYAAGGTLISAKLGQPLVGLNFNQERREADFRYGLVRVRENAESIAFYGGEAAERSGLVGRLRAALDNLGDLLVATRNVDFFTSCYRYLVTFLPAAVVAPLYFKGEIEFGVINQSSSAFSHILGDVSLVVYQIERLASFSAVTDRLGQMTEVLNGPASRLVAPPGPAGDAKIARGEIIADAARSAMATATASVSGGLNGTDQRIDRESPERLRLAGLTVRTPGAYGAQRPPLVTDLDLTLTSTSSVLIMGPSGAGKTSLLRAVAGLWEQGAGEVRWAAAAPRDPSSTDPAAGDAPNVAENSGLYFLPQRPYLVLGTLRQQLLYPTWIQPQRAEYSTFKPFWAKDEDEDGDGPRMMEFQCGVAGCAPKPDDAALIDALERVNLGYLLRRGTSTNAHPKEGETRLGSDVDEWSELAAGLDAVGDWSSILSLGEQQRLAFARVLLARPPVALLDEATSALDAANEARMYSLLRDLDDVAYVSVGHRGSLLGFHERVLRLEGDSSWRVVSAEAYGKELGRNGAARLEEA